MTTGILAAACMCLVLGQNAGGPFYLNHRNFGVPVEEVPAALRADLRELLLYSSDDQGRSWSHAAGPIAPDKKQFAFYAPGDGAYWLRVVQVHRNGVQEPDNNAIKNGPPDLKVVIDTVKPIIQSFQVQRQDDEVYVTWELQEDNLDPHGMRLEYQTKNALIERWKAAPIQAALKGQTHFNPGTKQALSLRLIVRDLAKNESWAARDLDGVLIPAGFSTAQDPSGGAVLPKPMEVQQPSPIPPPVGISTMMPPPVGINNTMPPPVGINNTMPPPVGINNTMPPPVGINNTMPPPMGFGNMMPPPPVNPGGVVMPAPSREVIGENVVADSSQPPPVKPVVPPPAFGGTHGPIAAPGETPLEARTIANPVAARHLPPLQFVNQHQVMLEYELKRVGPSGIGGIEVWLTKDDGQSWEPFAKDEDVQSGTITRRQQRKFDLRDAADRPFPDGIYGLSLVVKSRAGLGKRPRPGDVPEVRLEIDTQLPEAKLFMPVPDPQNPDQVLFKWRASDKNLAERPINLEFAARPDGEWLPIQLNLENAGRFTNEKVTGDFSWKVPPNTPLQVYLRLRVRDKAGNEGLAVTRQPQYVDLTEPEGRLIGVQPPPGKGP